MNKYTIYTNNIDTLQNFTSFDSAKLGEPDLHLSSCVRADLSLEDSASEHSFIDQWRAGFSAGVSVGMRPASFQAKAIFFDMDSTAIGQETIDELAAVCDGWGRNYSDMADLDELPPEKKEPDGGRPIEQPTEAEKQPSIAANVATITSRAMAGELDFADALRERVLLLAGQPVAVLEETKKRLIVEPGMIDFVETAKNHGIPCFLISGGFVEFAHGIAHRLGMAGFHANKLEVRQGQLTGRLEGPIVDASDKARWLHQICDSRGFNPDEAVAVGDGANDLEMMRGVGLSVGYAPKEILFPELDAVNYTGSHRFLQDFLFG